VSGYRRIEPIAADHQVDAFDCGSEAQNDWLRRYALQAHRGDTSRVYVICRGGTKEVVGYYALAAGSVEHDQVPARVERGTGRHRIPVVVLTRLGVDRREQGRGLGSELVRDALLQVTSVAATIGVRALVIHAETAEAAAFYRRISAAFAESPTNHLHLILLIKDLRKTLAGAEPMTRG
jgi:GNAT superfamily N-acetyltransferase